MLQIKGGMIMMKLQRVVWILVCVAFMSGVTSSAFAGVYLHFEGIKGEATDRAHKNWIEVLSIDWGAAAGTSSAEPLGKGPGSVGLVKRHDKATPKLNEACASGERFKTVRIHAEKASDSGARKTGYTKYVLTDVIITNCSGGSSGDGSSTEALTLNFAKVKWNYDKAVGEGTAGGASPR